jgi:endonuclease/exonuclease/phosphatase family metal-dependent hydrolase
MGKYQGEDLSQMTEPKWQLLSTSLKTNKDLSKVLDLAFCIKQTNVDICLLTEIGGRESIDNFNKHFLDNEYQVYHEPTNSDRGIDLAILVRHSIAPQCDFQIHRDKVFARGVLNLNYQISPDKNLRFLLTHLKSKLNKRGADFEGRSQREREVKRLIRISKEYPKDDVIISGDLNGIIYKDETEEELTSFATKAGLEDILEHENLPNFDRCTYIYYNKQHESHMMQLDYFLMTKELYSKTKAIGSVVDCDGKKRVNYPQTLKEKRALPSDHYPILIQLSI